MDNPHPTVFAAIAKEAVGSQGAASVVVAVAGLLCLAVGIASPSVILGILGARPPPAQRDVVRPSRTTGPGRPPHAAVPGALGPTGRVSALGSTPSAASSRSRAVTQA